MGSFIGLGRVKLRPDVHHLIHLTVFEYKIKQINFTWGGGGCALACDGLFGVFCDSITGY